MFRIFVLLFYVLLANPAVADKHPDTVEPSGLFERALALGLAADPHWRNLLHYRGAGDDAQRSEIRPGPFFISPIGDTDPAAELQATLAAAQAPLGENPDDHALCRYPARLRFLQDALAWQPQVRPVCTELQRWRQDGNITSISLIFASGDLGNPASFFGHILMKFNEAGETEQTAKALDDQSVNFGAIVPENENAFVYMVRGLAGGYPSSYSSTSYFQQRHDYGESQLRDLWDYRLNLDPAQVQLLVDHTWELQDARNTYYFLTRNCAYEFATLLSVVLGQPGLPRSKIWSTPADLFQELTEMTHPDGQPVVERVALVASRQRDFRQAYAALTKHEQRLLHALVSNRDPAGAITPPGAFRDVDQASQSRILEVALKYARFGAETFAADSPDAAQAQALQRQLVLLRLGHPAGAALGVPTPDLDPPHKGHRSSLLQVTPLFHTALGFGTELRVRPAYADLLSLDAGALPYSGVAMGDLRLMARDGQVWVRQLDLVRIDAFNVSRTGLPYDRANAWKLRIGAEDRDLSCDQCLVGFAEAGIGRSLVLGDAAAAAVFLATRAVFDRDYDISAEAGPAVGVVWSAGDAFRLSAHARYLATTDDGLHDRLSAGVDMRFGEAQTWDVRFRARYLDPQEADTATEFGLSASFFF